MKIIEALKKQKDLQRKAEDIRLKIGTYCSDLDHETPIYETPEKQREQISSWLQSHSDILSEIEKLRLSVQKTNLETQVTVEVTDGKRVTKSIAAWIHRRKDLAKLEAEAWLRLTNRGLSLRTYKKGTSEETFIANIRKYYDQQERDKWVEIFTSEPLRIDAALEIANAITDLL